MQRLYRHQTFGLVELYFSPRRRRGSYSIRVQSDRVRLNLSDRATEADALRILDERREFIESARRELNYCPLSPDLQLQTQTFLLRFVSSHKLSVELADGELRIGYPPEFDFQGVQNQQAIKKTFRKFLRQEAQRVLPARLLYLAKKHNFPEVKEVRVKDNKRSLGIYRKSLGAITLSVDLMLLPEHLSDTVILHELCHLYQPNHSPKFYATLAKYEPNHAYYRKEYNRILQERAWFR